MNKSSNPLVPVKLRDKNGHMVTRWVRMLETGEQELNLPAPSVPVPQPLVDYAFDALFPEFNEETEMLLDVFGQDVEYSDVFIRHSLDRLPLATLTAFRCTFTDDSSSGQNYLALAAYDYLYAMYSVGRTDESQKYYDQSVTNLNNALVFQSAMTELEKASAHRLGADDVEYIVNWALYSYEHPEDSPKVNRQYPESEVDYSKLPKRERRKALAYLITFRAMQFAGASEDTNDGRPRDETVAFIADRLDRQQEIASIMIARKTQDVGLLTEVLDNDAPVLTDGVL